MSCRIGKTRFDELVGVGSATPHGTKIMLKPHIEAMKSVIVTSSVTRRDVQRQPEDRLADRDAQGGRSQRLRDREQLEPAEPAEPRCGATNRLPSVPVWRSRSRISEALNTMPNSSASPAPATMA